MFLFKALPNKKWRVKTLTFLGMFIQEGPRYYNHLFYSAAPVKLIAGNWMSEMFFKPAKEIIQQELLVKKKTGQNSKALLDEISSVNSVCVHIRRGDYTAAWWAKKQLICNFEYYNKAIDYLRKSLSSPIFYIFSNSHEDIMWIQANYSFSTPVIYVDLNNPDYEDFRLMAHCKHFVLSNSTFSWWASYLSANNDKVIIVPSKWNSGVWDMTDLYLDCWKVLNVD